MTGGDPAATVSERRPAAPRAPVGACYARASWAPIQSISAGATRVQ